MKEKLLIFDLSEFTSFPPIARTTNAAVETGDGKVPNTLILQMNIPESCPHRSGKLTQWKFDIDKLEFDRSWIIL